MTHQIITTIALAVLLPLAVAGAIAGKRWAQEAYQDWQANRIARRNYREYLRKQESQ